VLVRYPHLAALRLSKGGFQLRRGREALALFAGALAKIDLNEPPQVGGLSTIGKAALEIRDRVT
jgi:hypothetical protein